MMPTREEILKMPAGREMDALIAVQVMELKKTDLEKSNCPYCGYEMWHGKDRSRCSICGEWRYSPYKEYSTDVSAAWEVVEKFRYKQFIHNPSYKDNWVCDLGTDIRHGTSEAETFPLAICRAALLAVQGASPTHDSP